MPCFKKRILNSQDSSIYEGSSLKKKQQGRKKLDDETQENLGTKRSDFSEGDLDREAWIQIAHGPQESILSACDDVASDNSNDREVKEGVLNFDSDEWQFNITKDSLPEYFFREKKMRRSITGEDRWIRRQMHKLHLLCLMSHTLFLHRISLDPLLQALLLSKCPHQLAESLITMNKDNEASSESFCSLVSELARWSGNFFRQNPSSLESNLQYADIIASVSRGLFERCNLNIKVLLFVTIMRALSLKVRLVCSIWPVPLSFSTKLHDSSPRLQSKPAADVTTCLGPLTSSLFLWVEVADKFHHPHARYVIVDPIMEDVLMEPLDMEQRLRKTYKHAGHTLGYVFALEDPSELKDLTPKYSSVWSAKTLRVRLDGKDSKDSDWLDRMITQWNSNQSLWSPMHCTGSDSDLDRELDQSEKLLLRKLRENEGFPEAIQAFKDHPLYVLERHLLKYECIYPKDSVLGYIRNEPIYPRSHVRPLHTREIWMKEAKSVIDGEKPVKIVKARMTKQKRHTLEVLYGSAELDAPLYGSWQVQDYVPPEAIDGKVPKNVYGKVDLFKPCMLPKGTVHIRIPGISRLARKLNIDYADATVGCSHLSKQRK